MTGGSLLLFHDDFIFDTYLCVGVDEVIRMLFGTFLWPVVMTCFTTRVCLTRGHPSRPGLSSVKSSFVTLMKVHTSYYYVL